MINTIPAAAATASAISASCSSCCPLLTPLQSRNLPVNQSTWMIIKSTQLKGRCHYKKLGEIFQKGWWKFTRFCCILDLNEHSERKSFILEGNKSKTKKNIINKIFSGVGGIHFWKKSILPKQNKFFQNNKSVDRNPVSCQDLISLIFCQQKLIFLSRINVFQNWNFLASEIEPGIEHKILS